MGVRERCKAVLENWLAKDYVSSSVVSPLITNIRKLILGSKIRSGRGERRNDKSATSSNKAGGSIVKDILEQDEGDDLAEVDYEAESSPRKRQRVNL